MLLSKLPSRFLATAFAFTFCAGVHAATYHWDGASTTDNADGGNGTWDTATTNWDTGETGGADTAWADSGDDNEARFGGAGGTVTISGTITSVNRIAFGATGYTLSSGTLTMNGAAATISVAPNVTASITSPIAGTGFTVTGGGKLFIGQSSTFTGPLTVSGTTLSVSSLQSPGLPASSPIKPSTFGNNPSAGENLILRDDAVLIYEAPTISGSGTGSTIRTIRIGGGGATIHAGANSGGITLSGSVAPLFGNGDTTLTLVSHSASDSSNFFGGTGDVTGFKNNGTSKLSLTIDGPGAWTANNKSVYTGDTLIRNGTLRLGNTKSDALSSTIIDTGAERQTQSTSIRKDINAALVIVSGSGTGKTKDIAGLRGSGDILLLHDSTPTNSDATVAAFGIRVGVTNASTTYAGKIIGITADTILSAGSVTDYALRKAGTGTFTLTGASAYTNKTLVEAGTLAVDGSLQSSLIEVSAGGTLSGTGVVKDVTLASGSTLAAGGADAPGALTAGALTWNGGATLRFRLGENGTGDMLRLDSLLKGTAGDFTVDFTDSIVSMDTAYTLIESSDLSAFSREDFLAKNFDGEAVVFELQNGRLLATFTAVPEPATYGLIGAGTLAGLALRRRANRRLTPRPARFPFPA